MSPAMPRAFHVMAKPTGSDCNLNCAYCFFLKKGRLYPDSDHDYLIFAAQAIVKEFPATFKGFPPRQKAASFTIDQALEKMNEVVSGAHH